MYLFLVVLYLHLSISNGFVSYKMYDKRNDFDISLTDFGFTCVYF